MLFFGRKKEEAKKELADIRQIKESVTSSAAPPAPEPPENSENQEARNASATEDWMKEFGSQEKIPEQAAEVPEDPKEWASQQIKLPPMPSPSTLTSSSPSLSSLPPLSPSSSPYPEHSRFSLGPIPRVQTLQTPNVPVFRRKQQPSAALAHRSASQSPNPSSVESIPESAPLFVKLDRYRNVLNTISDLRNTVSKVRNAFELFSEMERVKAENLRVIEAVMQKVESRIVDLDAEFMKPVQDLGIRGKGAGESDSESWSEPARQPADDSLHQMIQELHGQIGKLKKDLNQMGAEDKRLVEEFDE